jgi:hypothetical protein
LLSDDSRTYASWTVLTDKGKAVIAENDMPHAIEVRLDNKAKDNSTVRPGSSNIGFKTTHKRGSFNPLQAYYESEPEECDSDAVHQPSVSKTHSNTIDEAFGEEQVDNLLKLPPKPDYRQQYPHRPIVSDHDILDYEQHDNQIAERSQEEETEGVIFRAIMDRKRRKYEREKQKRDEDAERMMVTDTRSAYADAGFIDDDAEYFEPARIAWRRVDPDPAYLDSSVEHSDDDAHTIISHTEADDDEWLDCRNGKKMQKSLYEMKERERAIRENALKPESQRKTNLENPPASSERRSPPHLQIPRPESSRDYIYRSGIPPGYPITQPSYSAYPLYHDPYDTNYPVDYSGYHHDAFGYPTMDSAFASAYNAQHRNYAEGEGNIAPGQTIPQHRSSHNKTNPSQDKGDLYAKGVSAGDSWKRSTAFVQDIYNNGVYISIPPNDWPYS